MSRKGLKKPVAVPTYNYQALRCCQTDHVNTGRLEILSMLIKLKDIDIIWSLLHLCFMFVTSATGSLYCFHNIVVRLWSFEYL